MTGHSFNQDNQENAKSKKMKDTHYIVGLWWYSIRPKVHFSQFAAASMCENRKIAIEDLMMNLNWDWE